MRILAELFNALGQGLENRNGLRSADWTYAMASKVSPRWSVPWFNRGLMAKWARHWPQSQRFNLKAVEVDPQNQPAWWNLGIAATALEDWDLARKAWRGFGIDLPEGEGPLDMKLGSIPIRTNPSGTAEVVWCERLDPARARIMSVPFPESGRAFGDLLLTDGQPAGKRYVAGNLVSVFNEIQVLQPGDWDTYGVELTVPTPSDAQALEELARSRNTAAEDWSTVQVLCKACSEGVPHEHNPHEEQEPWKPERQFGIAAHAEDEVDALLSAWQAGGKGRSIGKRERLQTRSTSKSIS